MKDKELLNIVEKEVDSLCNHLAVECERKVTLEDGEEGIKYIKIEFDGNDLGYMIGNRGRHLDSLQFVFQVILGRKISQD